MTFIDIGNSSLVCTAFTRCFVDLVNAFILGASDVWALWALYQHFMTHLAAKFWIFSLIAKSSWQPVNVDLVYVYE